ncbi:hypothetical protein FRC10_004328 [Ceratobasidium sp. 414]|nr:hypothetical protein FRC10_004328 [Ceratobasidium sp. 414]
MFLGSNASGSYIAPDYGSLVPSNGSVSPFTSTVLHTLMQIDLSRSNESISSFDLASESASSLLLRNITAVLVKQTVSTQLTDCQPVLQPATVPFGLYSSDSLITQIWQDLPSTTTPGTVNRLSEDLAARMLYFGTSKFQTYTFIMTLAENITLVPTPADDSRVLIVLVYIRNCSSDPFETAFGPMPQACLEAPILNTINDTFRNTHATLACRNVRTISRAAYTPDGTVVARTSESFYAKPVLSTLNRLYMYTSSYGVVRYGGIGSLLNSDLVYSSSWQFPGCGITGPATPPNSTELEAVSAAWSKAVARVQHYETTVLEALVKQDITAISTPVLIAVPAYRLAVIPGALFVYGLSMIGAVCLLVALLLGTGDRRGNAFHAKSLSVWRIANELAVVREGGGGDMPVEASERRLKRDLGGVRVKRHARRDM